MTLVDSPSLQRTLTVASVPAGHVYVRHLSAPGGRSVRRLRDPDPGGTSSTAQRWWPPVMLRPEWAAAAEFDIFHLHFGFDATTPEQLDVLTRTLRQRGKPLVFTAHDLRNPHHSERALHDEQLDVLVPAADGLITLTAGAASEISERWGRTATVVPHPHVVDLRTVSALRAQRSSVPQDTFRVGLHVKSLRASMDPKRLMSTLVATVRDLDGAVLQVNGHNDVLKPGGARYDAELATLLDTEHRLGALELHVHDYLTDLELWTYLASLDVSVLPYRFGTHSGWLEACRDLQTTVVAPTCGHFADQGPVLSYVHDESQFDAESLRAAVTRAYVERPQLGADVGDRRRQRREIDESHDNLYRSLLA